MSSDNLSLLYVGLAIATMVLAGVSLRLGRHVFHPRRLRISLSCGVTTLEESGKSRSVFQIEVQNVGRDIVAIKSYGFIVGGRRHTCRDTGFLEQVTIDPGQATRLHISMDQCVNGQPFVELATGEEVRQQQPVHFDSLRLHTKRLKTFQPIRLKDPVVEEMMQQGLVLQEAGKNREAIGLFEGAAALTYDAAERARLLNCTAANYYRLGEYAQAQTSGRAALEKAHACGAEHEEGSTHWILAESALKLGALDMAAEHFKEGADHYAIAGDEKATLKAIDRLVQILGDHPDAESAEFYRSLAADRWQAKRHIDSSHADRSSRV